MDKININNLTGKCLAAMPLVEGEFAKTVVFICSHTPQGAMGFVINRVFKELSFNELAINLQCNMINHTYIPIYKGGSLEHEKGFILHDDSYNDVTTMEIGNGLRVTSSEQILQDLIKGQGPDKFLVLLGYAAWLPTQLEKEISNNLWLVADASKELVFNTLYEDKWNVALASLGINSSNLSVPLGHS